MNLSSSVCVGLGVPRDSMGDRGQRVVCQAVPCEVAATQRLAETAKSAATRLESGASGEEDKAAAVAVAAQAYSVAVGERTRAARNLAFLCTGARKRAFSPQRGRLAWVVGWTGRANGKAGATGLLCTH